MAIPKDPREKTRRQKRRRWSQAAGPPPDSFEGPDPLEGVQQLFSTSNVMGVPYQVEAREAASAAGSTAAQARYLHNLERRQAWHDARRALRQRRYLILKVISIGAAAAIPLATVVSAPPAVAGILGLVILFSEGLQQLFKDHEIALEHERAAAAITGQLRKYDVGAEPYDDGATAFMTLVANLEDVISKYESSYLEAVAKEGDAQ